MYSRCYRSFHPTTHFQPNAKQNKYTLPTDSKKIQRCESYTSFFLPPLSHTSCPYPLPYPFAPHPALTSRFSSLIRLKANSDATVIKEAFSLDDNFFGGGPPPAPSIQPLPGSPAYIAQKRSKRQSILVQNGITKTGTLMSRRYGTLHAIHSTLHAVHSTLHAVHSTLHAIHSTLPAVHTTLHAIHSTLHAIHTTLPAIHSTLLHSY
jgi:hypothetical protein